MYLCTKCGVKQIKWSGQCNGCREWNTLEETVVEKGKKGKNGISKTLSGITGITETSKRYKTNSKELNNVIGGGILPGSLTLLSGEPGIGKSTLTLQIAGWLGDKNVIYVSGEETIDQIKNRSERLGIKGENISLLAENNLENIIQTLKENKSDLIIIDSISVLYSENMTGSTGSINQVRYIAETFMEFCKKNNIAIIIIGHVTKDGNLAGPKTLEHLVDTVLYFEGNKFDSIRMLRCFKNRFGSSNEVGIFKMEEKGLQDLTNPGLEFTSTKDNIPTVGSALSITIEGTRPIIIEAESLTTYTKFGYPKRSASGVANSKIDMLIAILGKYTQIKLDSYDLYSNISRGIKIKEPGVDLAIAASIISSKTNKAIPKTSVFIGEISLTGKIKNIYELEKRVKEAVKIGFENIYIPDVDLPKKYDKNIIKVKDIKNFLENF